jgi:hypothetical protein
MWMAYSYAWRIVPDDLGICEPDGYVRLRAVVDDAGDAGPGEGRSMLLVTAPACSNVGVFVKVPRGSRWVTGGSITFTGRAVQREGDTVSQYLMVDTTRSRLHPASIAGLVVGAWGTFVFLAAFLHWRRRSKCPDVA